MANVWAVVLLEGPSAAGACDHNVHAAIGRMAQLVFGGRLVAAAQFHQVRGPFAFDLETLAGFQTPLLQLLRHHFGAFQRQLGICLGLANRIGVTNHPDALHTAEVALESLRHDLDGVVAAGPELGLAELE